MAAMDMYLNMNDSTSLQDMLDIDIKSEVDTLVGGYNDLSGFNFNNLPPLELEDTEIRFTSSNSNQSTYDFTEDSFSMVNPNAVMPVVVADDLRSPSPQLSRSHLTFSPCSIKIGFKTAAAEFKKDLLLEQFSVASIKKVVKPLKAKPLVVVKPVVKAVAKQNPTILPLKNALQSVNLSQPVNNVRIFTHNQNRKKTVNRVNAVENSGYPKPAYSYSCLIAMALKNSCSGCLPVSEIYNFMCRHFPYFKTAPSGWKNSVRHNLSLNKCFEKIEKPAINGTQRKGCLWAMNPTKIPKMDEEVRKCFKKDPSAIRNGMVNPDDLELLERGEMKFTYDEGDTFGDSCGSAESGEESETEIPVELEPQYTQVPENCIPINIDFIKVEQEEEIDVEEGVYNNINIEDDKEVLRVEMALAQKELLEYENCRGNKRQKLYIIQN